MNVITRRKKQKDLKKSDDDEKTVIFDVYGWLRSHHPQPTSPSIHQEKHWLLSFNYYYTQFPRALAKSTLDNIIIAAKIHNSMHSTNNPIRKKNPMTKSQRNSNNVTTKRWRKHFFWKKYRRNTAIAEVPPSKSKKESPLPQFQTPIIQSIMS